MKDKSKTVEFPPLAEDLNRICATEGARIYTELRSKYPETDLKSFDIVLNSLAFSLVCLGCNFAAPGMEKDFSALVASLIYREICVNRKKS